MLCITLLLAPTMGNCQPHASRHRQTEETPSGGRRLSDL